ncbi:putative Microsomal glutathione S-transferase 3 [Seiridium cardinale]|uniref:Microsomal glutathione S-transferase 3 n=1 Tax=Seiridium cardinale TaxID=138064 RepID=A0ABR2Y9U3_9PEZI
MASLTIPHNYGPVLVVGLGVIPFVGAMHGIVAENFRPAAGVPYPHFYASMEQCEQNVRTLFPTANIERPRKLVGNQNPANLAQPKAEQLNCAQRAHANYLENMAQTMMYTLVAGLKWPRATVTIGLTWVFWRLIFAHGYIYSGKPEGNGRLRGAPFWLCQGALWAMSAGAIARNLMKF